MIDTETDPEIALEHVVDLLSDPIRLEEGDIMLCTRAVDGARVGLAHGRGHIVIIRGRLAFTRALRHREWCHAV